MLPSIKTLESAFPGKGRELRRALESAHFVCEHPAAIAREAECYHPPGMADLRMTVLNAIAGTHGVEAVWREGETDAPAFEYLNTGDSYAATIIRWNDGRKNKYTVSSWGDIVERGRYA